MKELHPRIYLTGRYLEDESGDAVGSFILHDSGQCVIIETPPDPTWDYLTAVALQKLGSPEVLFIADTHDHEDHCSLELKYLIPHKYSFSRGKDWQYSQYFIGSEPLWVITCPKHSNTDTVFVFRGVALTGDIELGTYDSVNNEVHESTRIRSMIFLSNFEHETNYKIHSLISSHLNDTRTGITDWKGLVLPR